MGYMDMLKNYIGNSKTANLDQNPDLVEELGYAKPAEPAPAKDQTDKPVPDTTPPPAETPPVEKPADTATAATRG